MDAFVDVVRNGLMITGFVLIMMLVIEYLNVLTQGGWDRIIARWTWGQSALCSFLGATPGCLGAYAVASLYMHRVISAGALTAAMVATSGDEAFVMLALFPRTALWIFAALFAGGVLSGVTIDLVTKARRTRPTVHLDQYQSAHQDHPRCFPFSGRELITQWRSCSPHRGWLTFVLVLFLSGVVSGAIGHRHLAEAVNTEFGAAIEHAGHEDAREGAHEENYSDWDWVRITLFVLGAIALLVVVTVPDHFLDEHLWDHLVKIHAARVLVWTLGALAVTHLLLHGIDVCSLVEAHRFPVLLTACLVGLLPASGPHLVFVTLYAESAIPLSTLVASCIVQDGHGLIPTLAHSRRAFVSVKAVKFVIGLGVGLLGQAMGW